MPGWPDEGRRMVQGPIILALLERARVGSASLRRVVNAGAGEGLFSRLLLGIRGVEQVTEIDVSYQSHSRRPVEARQQIVAASLIAIPLANESVDLVLCTEVLEHISEDGQALDEMRRVIGPEGWLLISVPTPPAVFDPAHVREGYTPGELSEMLGLRGLEVVEMRYCMYAMFQLLLRTWRRYGWMPRGVVRGLALLDQVCPFGRPMNLVILARLPAPKDAL